MRITQISEGGVLTVFEFPLLAEVPVVVTGIVPVSKFEQSGQISGSSMWPKSTEPEVDKASSVHKGKEEIAYVNRAQF